VREGVLAGSVDDPTGDFSPVGHQNLPQQTTHQLLQLRTTNLGYMGDFTKAKTLLPKQKGTKDLIS
jgi:hypothetical protein